MACLRDRIEKRIPGGDRVSRCSRLGRLSDARSICSVGVNTFRCQRPTTSTGCKARGGRVPEPGLRHPRSEGADKLRRASTANRPGPGVPVRSPRRPAGRRRRARRPRRGSRACPISSPGLVGMGQADIATCIQIGEATATASDAMHARHKRDGAPVVPDRRGLSGRLSAESRGADSVGRSARFTLVFLRNWGSAEAVARA